MSLIVIQTFRVLLFSYCIAVIKKYFAVWIMWLNYTLWIVSILVSVELLTFYSPFFISLRSKGFHENSSRHDSWKLRVYKMVSYRTFKRLLTNHQTVWFTSAWDLIYAALILKTQPRRRSSKRSPNWSRELCGSGRQTHYRDSRATWCWANGCHSQTF